MKLFTFVPLGLLSIVFTVMYFALLFAVFLLFLIAIITRRLWMPAMMIAVISCAPANYAYVCETVREKGSAVYQLTPGQYEMLNRHKSIIIGTDTFWYEDMRYCYKTKIK